MDKFDKEHSKVTKNLREFKTSHSILQTKHSKVTENMKKIQAEEILKDPIPPNIRGI